MHMSASVILLTEGVFALEKVSSNVLSFHVLAQSDIADQLGRELGFSLQSK